MKLTGIVLFLSLSLQLAYSGEMTPWQIQSEDENFLELNSLRFTNRAQCAADSRKPSRSAFIMLDSVNVGKSFYRFSKITDSGDVSQETKLGIEKYRYTTIELIKIISNKLLSGKLPLIRTDIESYKGTEFYTALKDCDSGSCAELNYIIHRLWVFEEISATIDDAISKNDYLNLDFDSVEHNDARLSCYYIKKFSSLQGHLFSSSPNTKTAQNIAETVAESKKYLVDCNSIDQQENLKVSNYQIDLINISDRNWNKKGFDFWNSLKIYLTWAYRFSDEVKALAYPYAHVVRSIALEENILFIPNGCKSIISPKCDSKTLNLNSMRQFAQMSEQELFRTDFHAQISEGAENDLMNTPIEDVNNDILNLTRSQSASDWAERFRSKFSKTRGVVKLKFINAVNKLKALKSHLTKNEFVKELKNSEKLALENDSVKAEIYFLCSEFKVATDENYSFFNDEIDFLSNSSSLDSYSERIGGEAIANYVSYFREISKPINNFCNDLAKKNFWGEGFEVDRENFTSWYKEVTLNKKQPFKTNIVRKISKEVSPILFYGKKDQGYINHKKVICAEGANCGRVLLESIFDLYSSLRYADTLLPPGEIQAPSMLNNVNEKTACKMYDPYRKKRRVIFQFFYDVVRSATFGLLPSPVYVSTEVKDKQVVSMERLMEDGKITFDPKVDGYKFRHSLVADLGGLFGIPCAISISGASINPVKYYRFNGVSVGTCSETRVNNLVVHSSTDMNSYSYDNSKCVSCAINLETVVGGLASIEPITRSAYILARGVWNLFKGLRDPFDIPRRWSLNPQDTYNTYNKYGQVNKYCLRQLLKGRACLANVCEGSVARNVNKFLKGSIQATNIPKGKGNGYIKLSTCEEPITVGLRYNRNRICKRNSEITQSDFIIPRGCENILKERDE